MLAIRLLPGQLRQMGDYTAAFVTEQGVGSAYGHSRRHLPERAIGALDAYCRRHRPVQANLRGTFTTI